VTFIEAVPKSEHAKHGYKHADSHGVEHDVTQDRVRLGRHHHNTGTKAKPEDFQHE
jgi:hypothetical protein